MSRKGKEQVTISEESLWKCFLNLFLNKLEARSLCQKVTAARGGTVGIVARRIVQV